MTLTEAREKLGVLQDKLSAYAHACELIFYDGCTGAPADTAENRGHTLSILSAERYRLAAGGDTEEILETLDACRDELSERERRTVCLLLKDIRQLRKIPMKEYVAYQETLVKADDVWRRAKERSDFALFEPLLEEIFAYNLRFAGYCAPEKKPYDYWLGEYEDGLTMETCDEFFALLRGCIVPLLKRVAAVPQACDGLLRGSFPREKQEELSAYVMSVMGIDAGHCALGVTEHPFTTSLGSHFDVRITTNYKPESFASSLYSVIHEGGHALYELGIDGSMAYTALDGGVSMGIHESQSRFYENLLGRSRAFTGFLFPKLRELFPQALATYTPDDLYRAVNRARPSLIRTEADEFTYCLHIMVRYELEKRVFAGELSVRELPGEWNRLYREYLGVEVPDDRRGVLQDSHWSGGSIGYFPSYALGSAYGAQLLRKMKETVDVDGCLAAGDLAPINDWNREHIWKYGRLYRPGELLERALGEKFDPSAYTGYLEAKCRDIYGV